MSVMERITKSWEEAPAVFEKRVAAGDVTWQVDWDFLLYGKLVASSLTAQLLSFHAFFTHGPAAQYIAGAISSRYS
jgi:hypothetical protein